MNIKNLVKNKLKPDGLAYKIAGIIYRFLPGPMWKRWKMEKFRKKCYREFDKNRIVKLTLNNDIECYYEAISQKNYWHLSIQNYENHGYFGRFLKKGDVVLDIGGHVGAWTIPYAKFVGKDGYVYVFEPEKEGFHAIKRNIALNDVQENIQPIQVAISDKNEKMKFYVRPDKDTHSIFEKTPGPSPLGIQHEYDVNVHTIDSLIEKGVIRQPNFIKLDVEGAELKALEGMRKTVNKARAIFIECHLTLKIDFGLGDPVEVVSSKLKELGVKCIIQYDDEHVMGLFDTESFSFEPNDNILFSHKT